MNSFAVYFKVSIAKIRHVCFGVPQHRQQLFLTKNPKISLFGGTEGGGGRRREGVKHKHGPAGLSL